MPEPLTLHVVLYSQPVTAPPGAPQVDQAPDGAIFHTEPEALIMAAMAHSNGLATIVGTLKVTHQTDGQGAADALRPQDQMYGKVFEDLQAAGRIS